jgi:hypothetical protein
LSIASALTLIAPVTRQVISAGEKLGQRHALLGTSRKWA